jgi:hypothetical protein
LKFVKFFIKGFLNKKYPTTVSGAGILPAIAFEKKALPKNQKTYSRHPEVNL